MLYNKITFSIFSVLVLLCFSIGFFIGSGDQDNLIMQGGLLDYNFIFLIFISNAFTILLLFFVAPFGIAIPFVIKILITIGLAAGNSGINPLIYFPVSLIHGVFELFALLVISYVSTKNLHIIYQIIKKKLPSNYYWHFNLGILKKELPLVFSLLLIGAVLEVMVSNRIIAFILT
ncbi:hypothetical protein [Metabacillus sp. SLBN-84]